MSSDIPISFGRGKMEQFSYLIITGVFMLIFAALEPYIAKGLFGVDENYYQQYEIFFSLSGALFGFIFAQLYIRAHSKRVRG